MRLALAVLLSLVLAGCAGGGAPAEAAPEVEEFEDIGGTASAGKGVLLGVVVDETITPLAGISISLPRPDGSLDNRTTDDVGRFAYGELEPGTYVVTASHLLYSEAKTTVEVVADDPDPPIHRMQLALRFGQEPYSEPFKFEGFIQCGYVALILSSLCLNDYSTLVVPGGVYPQARETLDSRGYVSSVGGGWQTIVFELSWEPTTGATSREMFILTSFYNRTASDAYGKVGGETPVLMRLELGIEGEGAQGVGGSNDTYLPAEGQPDLYTFAGIDGDNLAFGYSQKFTVFQHNFYYGKPPEGWSFLAGDPLPF